MTKVQVRNLVDNYINQSSPNSTYATVGNLWLQNITSAIRRALIYGPNPVPRGATVISAKMRVYNVQAWPGSVSLACHQITSAWNTSRVSWNTAPTYGSGKNAVKVDTPAGTMWEFDVTDWFQAISNGSSKWYGFIFLTNSGIVTRSLHSVNSPHTTKRPYIEVEWRDNPAEPDALSPSGGRAITSDKPLLTFNYNDPSGNDPLDAIQVQVGTTEALVNAGSGEWDSGVVVTEDPQLDLLFTSYPGLAAGATAWWRVRVRDDTGLWSVWSDAVSFTRVLMGNLTMLVDGDNDGVYSANPAVSWTFTGATQKSYHVFVVDPATDEQVYNSGKITSSATSHGIPEGYIKKDPFLYSFFVRIYDTIAREATPYQPTYVQAVLPNLPIASVGAHGITGLSVVLDPVFPQVDLTWTRASTPDYYEIYRSKDNVNFECIDVVDGGSLLVSGTSYKYEDLTAPSYRQSYWRIRAVNGGLHTSATGSVGAEPERIAPILMRPDKSDVIIFLNPDRSRNNTDIQELVEVQGGPPVLITQHIGGESGSIKGLLTSEIYPYTAKQMKDSWNRLRRDSGVTLYLYFADEMLKVAAYNMNIDNRKKNEGMTYIVSMDWVVVP